MPASKVSCIHTGVDSGMVPPVCIASIDSGVGDYNVSNRCALFGADFHEPTTQTCYKRNVID